MKRRRRRRRRQSFDGGKMFFYDCQTGEELVFWSFVGRRRLHFRRPPCIIRSDPSSALHGLFLFQGLFICKRTQAISQPKQRTNPKMKRLDETKAKDNLSKLQFPPDWLSSLFLSSRLFGHRPLADRCWSLDWRLSCAFSCQPIVSFSLVTWETSTGSASSAVYFFNGGSGREFLFFFFTTHYLKDHTKWITNWSLYFVTTKKTNVFISLKI